MYFIITVPLFYVLDIKEGKRKPEKQIPAKNEEGITRKPYESSDIILQHRRGAQFCRKSSERGGGTGGPRGGHDGYDDSGRAPDVCHSGRELCKNRKVHSPAVSDAVPGRLRHFVRPEKIPGILRMRADGKKTGAVSGGQRFRCDCDAAPVSCGDHDGHEAAGHASAESGGHCHGLYLHPLLGGDGLRLLCDSPRGSERGICSQGDS